MEMTVGRLPTLFCSLTAALVASHYLPKIESLSLHVCPCKLLICLSVLYPILHTQQCVHYNLKYMLTSFTPQGRQIAVYSAV